MATKLFLRDSASDVSVGSETKKELLLTQGSSVVSTDATATAAGPTSGVQCKKSTVLVTWYSNPLDAVTISGNISFNFWGLESAAQANTGLDVLIERCDSAGNVLSTILRAERGTELGTSASVQTWGPTAPTSTALNNGDRIKVTVFGNDAGGNMGNGRTFTMNYGAGTGVNGDSYVNFTETITETVLQALTGAAAGVAVSSGAITQEIPLAGSGVGVAVSDGDLELSIPLAGSAAGIAVCSGALTVTPAGGTVIVQHSFTESSNINLSSSTPEVGGPWVDHPHANYTTPFAVDPTLDDIYSTGTAAYYADNAFPSADYYVEADFRHHTTVSQNVAICARMDVTADTMYIVRFNSGTTWEMRRIVSGAATTLTGGTSTSHAPSAGNLARGRFVVEGDQLSFYVYVAGTPTLVIGPITDTNITAAGRAGVRNAGAASETTGIHLDNFEAGTLSAGESHALTGDAVGVGASDGDIELSIPLAGSAVGVSVAAGALTVSGGIDLDGSALGAAVASGSMDHAVPLAGGAAGVSVASGALTVGGGVDLTGSAVGVGRSDAFLAGTAFVAYQANLQHGKGTDDVTNYSRQTAILLSGTDIVSVQEKGTSDTGWNSALTAAGYTQAVYRENDPTQGDGPAIWYRNSTVTVIDTWQTDLSTNAIGWNGTTNVDKAAVAAKVQIGPKVFYVVSTHLAWSAGADSDGSTYSAIRVAQINTLNAWVATFRTDGLDVFLLGDLNFGPDYPKNPSGLQHDLFTEEGYVDLWQEGLADSKALAPWDDRNADGSPDMPLSNLTTRTHDLRRIDYAMLKTDVGNLGLREISLPDHRATSGTVIQTWGTPDDLGVRPSDHNWIRVVMNLTDGAVSLAGSTVGVGAVSGSMTHAVPLAGSAAAVSVASGSLSQSIPLAGSSLGVAVASGSMDHAVPLVGSAVAVSVVSGSMDHAVPLAGGALGVAIAAGSLTVTSPGVNLDGIATGVAVASGSLQIAKSMAGSAAGISVASGSLSVAVQLAGSAVGSSSAAGAMTKAMSLAGSVAGLSVSGAGVSLAKAMSGSSVGVSTVSGSVIIAKPLTGSAFGIAATTGSIDVGLLKSALFIDHRVVSLSTIELSSTHIRPIEHFAIGISRDEDNAQL